MRKSLLESIVLPSMVTGAFWRREASEGRTMLGLVSKGFNSGMLNNSFNFFIFPSRSSRKESNRNFTLLVRGWSSPNLIIAAVYSSPTSLIKLLVASTSVRRRLYPLRVSNDAGGRFNDWRYWLSRMFGKSLVMDDSSLFKVAAVFSS